MEAGSVYRELVDLNERLENELNRHAKKIKDLGSRYVDAFHESTRALSSATARDAEEDRHVFLSAAITLLEDKPRNGKVDTIKGRLIKRGQLQKRSRAKGTIKKWKPKDISLRFGQLLHDEVFEGGAVLQRQDVKHVSLARARSVKIENDVLKVVTADDRNPHEFTALAPAGATEDERRRQLEDWKYAFQFAVAHVPPNRRELLNEALCEPQGREGQHRFEDVRQQLNGACCKRDYLSALRNLATLTVEAKWVQKQSQMESEQQHKQRGAGAAANGVTAKSKGAMQKVWSWAGTATRNSSPAMQPSRSSSTAPCADQVFLDMKRDKVKVAGELIVNDPDRAFGTLTRKILELHPRPPEAATGVASDDSSVADMAADDSRHLNPLRARMLSPTAARSGSTLSPTPGDGAGWPKLTEERALACAHLVLVKAATRTQGGGDAYFAAHLLCRSDRLSQELADGMGNVPMLSPLQGGDDAADPIEINIERREHRFGHGHGSPVLSNGSEGSASQDDSELGMIKGLEIEVRVSNNFELKGPCGEGGEWRRWATVRADFNQKFFLADEAEELVAGEGTVSVSVQDLVEGGEG